ncbi:MAG TPA: DUF3800 domain-containing protein [Patescibacteria group bacterium]|nr:DUF3800 domain-containing protein [Patescibacteria group bacterium]
MNTDAGDGNKRTGDAEGRRVARRKSHLLAEAGRVSRALELLLDRAGHPADAARRLTQEIREAEQTEALKAVGRIESRRRFKGGPVRTPAAPDRWLLFVDESGRSYRGHTDYFSLGAVALTGAEAERFRARADELKQRFWGHTGVTFHEPYMRHHDEDYYFDGDVERQAEFDHAVDVLVRETDFLVFGVGIRKKAFADFLALESDAYLPFDVYAVAMHMLLERFVDFRATSGGERTRSKVLLEAQGPREDAEHQRVFADVLLHGTQWVPESAFQQWLETGVLFPSKHGSDPMELADMVSRDVYEWIEAGCVGAPERWRMLGDRVYCRGDGMQGKFGIKVFPDEDVREAIEAHRLSCGAK